jgi:hypothetical protein
MTSLPAMHPLRVLGALILAFMSASAHAFPFDPVWERATVLGPVSPYGMATADFDGDGIDEVFVASASMTPTIVAFSNAGTPLVQRQVIALPRPLSTFVDLHAAPSSQGPVLVAVTGSRWSVEPALVTVYSGWPVSEIARNTLPTGPLASHVADADNDGSPELLSLYNAEVRATNLQNGALMWSVPVTEGRAVTTFNLDADPALEIVISGASGQVIDGATRLPEWIYPDGFGVRLAAGKVGPQGAPGFVGASEAFTVYRTTPWSPIWDEARFRTDTLHVADLDGTGTGEIIIAEHFGGWIRVFDSQTRALKSEIGPSVSGAGSIVTPRITTGSRRQLLYALPSLSGSASNALTLADSESGAVLKSLASDRQGITTTAIGDFNSDGRSELILGTGDGWSGSVRIVNPQSGAEEWQSPSSGAPTDPLYMHAKRFLSTQLDGDPAREIVIVGTNAHRSRIVVLDGASKTVQRVIEDDFGNGPLAGRRIYDAALLDFNGDGFEDIAVSTDASSSTESGVRLHVFSLRTGELLWESIRIDSGRWSSRGLFALNSGGQRYLVAAVTTGLRAFNLQTQLLEWTFLSNIHRALLVEHAPGGAEIVLQSNTGGVTHLDAATLQVRRTYSLAEPSRALEAMPSAPYLISASAHALTLLRLDGSVAGGIESLSSGSEVASLAVASSGNTTQLLIGTDYGFRLLNLNPDGLFKDGFDPR